MDCEPFCSSSRAPFAASLILTGIHAYLGVHVVERGVIFVDLSLAQIAALGATIACCCRSRAAIRTVRRSTGSAWFHVHRRGRVLDDPQPARADSAGGDHRHFVCGGVGGGDSRDEQVDVRRPSTSRTCSSATSSRSRGRR